MSNETVSLYVVATPIGNLGDLSARATETLTKVALIAAEDTRQTRRLLDHIGARTPMVPLHEHNERDQVDSLIEKMRGGVAIALVSDAGTPLISDPGFRLVRAAHHAGLRVAAVPGPCAAIAALSAAGLPTDRFVFEGFLSPRSAARRERLEQLRTESRTLIFYVPARQLRVVLDDCAEVMGHNRTAVVAREISKLYESYYHGNLDELARRASTDADMNRGEVVVLVSGLDASAEDGREPAMQVLRALLEAGLPVKQAVEIAIRLTGNTRNRLYELALKIKSDSSPED